MATEPTIEEYPYQVGRMVYRTRQEAEAALARADVAYPNHAAKIIDRRAA